MKKRILVAILSMTFIFGLCACGAKTTSENSQVESANVGEEANLSSGAENEKGNADTGVELVDDQTLKDESEPNMSAYVEELKLKREQERSKRKDELQAIIDDENLTEEQKQPAVDEMVQLYDFVEKEAAAEMMLEAKGFTCIMVSIEDANSCEVMLDMGEKTDEKIAQIEEIIKRKTHVSLEGIHITAIHAEDAPVEELD